MVADSAGKLAYKGATDASGLFATPKLPPGNYAVQFTSNSAPTGSRYTLVVAAGKKKVAANAVAAEKLAGRGVAMKIDVGAGLNITGQVAAEDKNTAPMGRNGKPMIWIARRTGTNLPPHWAESDSAEAREAMTSGTLSAKNLQDRSNQGIAPVDPGLKHYPGDHGD
ncbi:MAG: carboxypeptidase-like regulatory domain-containing protein [Chthoniobacterales bacterium]